jgi:hypothetical protein
MEEWKKTGIISSLSRINGFPRQEIFILRTAAFVPRDRDNINIFVGASKYDR